MVTELIKQYLVFIPLYFLAVSAVIIDIKKGIVPNVLTFSMMLLGIIIRTFQGTKYICFTYTFIENSHLNGFLFSLTGILIAFAIFYLVFALGYFSAGDGKLAMGIAAFVGTEFFLKSLLIIFAYGFFTAIIVLLKRGNASQMMQHLYIKYLLRAPLDDSNDTIQTAQKEKMFPYAVNLLLGTATWHLVTFFYF